MAKHATTIREQPRESLVIRELPLESIRFNATNPRRTKDPAKMAELRESVARHGVLEPILVRVIKWDKDGAPQEAYELVAGERRLLAAGATEMRTIPARVLELSDVEVLEIQIVENAQREDLHPLEEGDGFRRLHEHYNWPIEDIAAKVGMTRGYVYTRIHLAKLPEEVQKLWIDGGLNLGLAKLCAQIRRPVDQVAAARVFAGVDEKGKPQKYRQHSEQEDTPYRPLSIERARAHVEGFTATLDRVGWSLEDATLVVAAGACTTCVKRSSAQASLFDEHRPGADRCLDLECFAEKTACHAQRKVDAAQAEGRVVLSGKVADRALAEASPWQRGKFVNATAVLHQDPQGRELRHRLPKAWLAEHEVLAVTPAGDTVALVDRKAAMEELRKKHSWAVPVRRNADGDDRNRKRREKEKIDRARALERVPAIVKAASRGAQTRPEVLAWLITTHGAALYWEEVFKARGFAASKLASFDAQLAKVVAEHEGDAGALRGLLVEAVLRTELEGCLSKELEKLLTGAERVFGVEAPKSSPPAKPAKKAKKATAPKPKKGA